MSSRNKKEVRMSAELKRLTLRLPQQQIDEIKNAAVEQSSNYSKLVDSIFSSSLTSPGKTRKNGHSVGRDLKSTELAEFTIYLPPTLIIEFKKAAITQHRSISSLAFDFFESYLEPRRKRSVYAAHR